MSCHIKGCRQKVVETIDGMETCELHIETVGTIASDANKKRVPQKIDAMIHNREVLQ